MLIVIVKSSARKYGVKPECNQGDFLDTAVIWRQTIGITELFKLYCLNRFDSFYKKGRQE
jgi:hypothetical protein